MSMPPPDLEAVAADQTPTGALPLRGVRILAIEQYGAGPFATMVLADLGAEVIKIEVPGNGDIGRSVPPWTGEDDSLFFQSLNRGKSSVVIDLKEPRGREVFTRLVANSDAVFSNARGSSAASLAITYDDLKAYNPAIVCAFLTGFGRQGPRADQPAYDYIIQALSGMAALGGEPGGPPARAGVSVVDFSAGLAAAVALLAGVHRARATGLGGDVDTSLFATALNLTNYVASWVLTRDYQPERQPRGGHPSIVPSQLFEAADGWLMVMCQTNAFYRELSTRLAVPELAAERFATMGLRFQNRQELLAMLEKIFKAGSVAHWLDLLEGGVPVAPVNDVGSALRDPQVEAEDLIIEYQHEQFGLVRQVAGPIKTGPAPRRVARGPRLGEHTLAVLGSVAGVSAEALAGLEADGVVQGERKKAAKEPGKEEVNRA
ncbi:MAG TPA: CoA transferase [Trueperaceae bacterium]|nr:CoA transferase [Trueperaceae bacterium]